MNYMESWEGLEREEERGIDLIKMCVQCFQRINSKK